MFRLTTLWLTATLTLAILSITGCMVGPKYHRPTTPVPPQFKEGGTPDSGTPDIAYSDWWRVFTDPELSRLETEADAANQDIKLAVARVEQAEAGARYARSFLFPTVSVGVAASRTREAQNRSNNGTPGAACAIRLRLPKQQNKRRRPTSGLSASP
jgi:multidrug efflux system outer membrane protein